jgi:hypothetical protein
VAAFAGVGGALHHIEKQLIFAARRICVLRSVLGLVFQAKPALGVDFNFAFLCVAPKMKVQAHYEVRSSSPHSPPFYPGGVVASAKDLLYSRPKVDFIDSSSGGLRILEKEFRVETLKIFAEGADKGPEEMVGIYNCIARD